MSEIQLERGNESADFQISSHSQGAPVFKLLPSVLVGPVKWLSSAESQRWLARDVLESIGVGHL